MLWTTIALESFIILVLIFLNGLLAMSEIAIVSSRKARLQQLATNGSLGARIALDLANSPSNFLAAIQIGITLIGIFAGAFGGATIADQLTGQLATIPSLAPYSDAIGLGIVVMTVTILTLIFGELVPKRLALGNSERVAATVAPLIRLVSLIAKPAVKFLSLTTETVLKLAGVKTEINAPVTEEEVKIMVEQGTKAGVFAREEESMIKRVIAFGDRRVGELMTQRLKVSTLNLHDPFEENLKKILAAPHSYFPVCEGTIDKLIGVIAVKCILARMAREKALPVDLRKCITEPLFVSETMPALSLLERFKRSGKHLALVMDEYGGTAGLVTVIDVLEAIVGDLPLEEEVAAAKIVKRDDGSYLVDGMVPIHEFFEFLQTGGPRFNMVGDYQTVGGFVMSELGRIPREGESFVWRGYRLEVVDMDGHRVDKVLVTPPTIVTPPQQNNSVTDDNQGENKRF